MLSARSFLIRGLLAGLIAGVIAFPIAYLIGEPSLDAAIALEGAAAPAEPAGADPPAGHSHEQGTPAHSHDEGGTGISRPLQATLGLLTGTAAAGTALGGLVGMLSALAIGRFGRLGARGSTLLVTGLAFVALYAVPALIYPPNPPAVGSGGTIGVRTALYFVAVAVSVIAAVVAVLVGRRLGARIGSWYATLAATGGYLLVLVVAATLLPRYNEIPAGFPAALLYEFRTASFLIQLALWTVLAVVLAELVGRLSRSAPVPALAAVGD